MAHPSDQQQQAVLDRAAFAQELSTLALRAPKQRCSELMKTLRGHLIEGPKLRAIVHEANPDAPTRLVLLSESLTQDNLPQAVQALLGPLSEGKCELVPHKLTLDYSHLTADKVLRKLLPAGVDPPSSFEAVGHIAHLNLRDEQLPYKLLIGQVLLDKNPCIKTVVNKVGAIDTEFRVFTMELLAGEPRTETEVIQHGTKFRLDFAQVYWNSRLEAEHSRLVERYFKRGEVVVDVMAGIGPFAVPAAQQGCQVYANDLNPASTRYMAANVKLNHVAKQVHVFNMDGRAFVRLLCDAPPMQQQQQRDPAPPPQQEQGQQQQERGQDQQQAQLPAEQQGHLQGQSQGPAMLPGPEAGAAQQIQGQRQHHDPPTAPTPTKAAPTTVARPGMVLGPAGGASQPPSLWNLPDVPPTPLGLALPPKGGLLFHHAVMNLPASAVEFLDAFNGAFDPATWRGRALPLVHVYTFKPAAMTQEDVIKRVEHYLGGPLDEEATVHQVRDVAPNKLMLCVSFRVPKAVAFNGRVDVADEQNSKRQRVDV